MFEKTTGRRRPVILVIDDSPSTTQLLSSAVADIGEVWTAGNGMQGLELARDKRPDLVLLDIEMPGMDGYAVCEAMKADPITADCAIIFVTGHDATVHEVQSLVSGGLDFLTKPLNVPVVRARVQIQLKLKYQADALARAQRDLASVVRNLPAFVSYWGMDLRNRFCNDPDGHWFGLTARAMREQHLESVLGAAAFATMQTPVEEVLKGKQSSFELVLEPPGQPLRYVQASLITGRTEGTIDGFLMLLTDITDHKVAKQALHNEKERFRTILSSIGDAVVVTDNQGNIMFVNPIAEEMTGWQSCEAMQRPIEDVMPLHDANSGEPVRNPARIALQENRIIGVTTNYMLQCRNQREWPVETSASPIHDHEGNPAGAVMVFHDVSAARALAIKMTHLAQHDVLTGLPNRILLEDRTVQAMAMSRREGKRVAMLFIDLDHFKFINDSLGHATGDEVLRQVAQRLRSRLRDSDTMSRRGGDEFVVLLPGLDSVEQAGTIAEMLIGETASPYVVGNNKFGLTFSIGISLFPDDSDDQETLLRHADAAMNLAKQTGRNRYQFFSRDIEDKMRKRYALAHQLRHAIEKQHFEVFYQAKVDIARHTIVGLEALVRWRHESGRLISPGEFIPLAEESNLIEPIGQFVLVQACRQVYAWHQQGQSVPVSVNVSAVQFLNPVFPQTVHDALLQSGLPARLLELEITEGVLMHDVAAARVTLEKLKQLGVRLAIDDFGTGYSSLAYLKRFPVDVLKIDQSFVRDMLTDTGDSKIISAIINLGRGLGMELVAEGVEQQAQADALHRLGCTIMQGFLYSRPAPAAEVGKVLSRLTLPTPGSVPIVKPDVRHHANP